MFTSSRVLALGEKNAFYQKPPTPTAIPTSLKQRSTSSARPLQLYEATHRQRGFELSDFRSGGKRREYDST